MSNYHIPVMLKEVLDFLQIKKDHWYVDCNLGGGGHTKGILEKGGNVLGIDLDPDAIKQVIREFGSGQYSLDRVINVRDGLKIIQNDFVVTNVNTDVFLQKRHQAKNPERINNAAVRQGHIIWHISDALGLGIFHHEFSNLRFKIRSSAHCLLVVGFRQKLQNF